MVPFSFCGDEMRLLPGRAVFWSRESALLVADLHLEKASFHAAGGQMLPPYDSRDTLERVALAIRDTGARRVYALGDSFHDPAAPARMEPHTTGMLAALTRAVSWVWITGNHDAGAEKSVGGDMVEEIRTGGLVLRHRACPKEPTPEISGHFHPKLMVRARGRRIARPCAVRASGGRNGTGGRVVPPPFGTPAGGRGAAAPAIVAAMQPARAIDALVASGSRLVSYPLWRAGA